MLEIFSVNSRLALLMVIVCLVSYVGAMPLGESQEETETQPLVKDYLSEMHPDSVTSHHRERASRYYPLNNRPIDVVGQLMDANGVTDFGDYASKIAAPPGSYDVVSQLMHTDGVTGKHRGGWLKNAAWNRRKDVVEQLENTVTGQSVDR